METKTTRTTCHGCPNLVKRYNSTDTIQFAAQCAVSLTKMPDSSLIPMTIDEKAGPMKKLDTPSWCPLNQGLKTKIYRPEIKYENEQTKDNKTEGNEPKREFKALTYNEKRERLKQLPKRLNWEDIKIGELYVIPRIMYQKCKIIKVNTKTKDTITYSEIDFKGGETKSFTSLNPNDIELVFMTKYLKF